MSQDTTTKQQVTEPLIDPTPIQPWSAETEADKLMDELFADIDQILEGGNRLPTEPVKPEYVSLKSIVIPQLPIPSAVKPTQETIEKVSPKLTEAKSIELSEKHKEIAPLVSSSDNRSSWSLAKLLLATILASGSVILIWLLTSQKKLTWPWLVNIAASPTAPNRVVSQSDAEFAKYALRALEVIDNKAKANQQKTSASTPTNTSSPQTIPAPSNRTLAPSQPQRVLERVYIPVYPPQSSGTQQTPPAAARSSVPTFSPAAPSPKNQNSTPASSPTAQRPTPTSSPTAQRPTSASSPTAQRPTAAPASPQAAAPAPLPTIPTVPPSVVVPIAPPTQSTASASQYTFVGFWGMGEQSAALFQVGGVIQRIQVGEAIGESGWTLVSVAEQEAVIRRNGEVRSVYAGQTF